MNGFVQKVHRRIREKELFKRDDHLVLAVSGGPDSISMVRALCTLRYRVTLAWVDHGIRTSAAVEGQLVKRLAESLNVPFQPLRASPVGQSEAELRDARYGVLSTLDGDWIATAHTASDQAETVLMRMIRGAGITGLTGIPDIRGRYVRPLLGVTREEVLAYLTSLKQEFATDPTNASLDPLRNRVRHRLIPMLRDEFQPQIVRSLQRLAESVQLDRNVVELSAAYHLANHGAAVQALRDIPEGLRIHVLRALCPVSMTSERVQAVSRLVTGRSRGTVQIEGCISAAIEEGKIVFRAHAPE